MTSSDAVTTASDSGDGAPSSSAAGEAAAPASSENASAEAERDDLWRAYEHIQQHYETDLQLFSVRMNMFLLIQSGLVALLGSSVASGTADVPHLRTAAASFGLAMAAAWLLVAVSSYSWLKTWRAQMTSLALKLDPQKKEFGGTFDPDVRRCLHRDAYGPGRSKPDQRRLIGRPQPLWRMSESLSWFVRPTFVTCCLPIIFIAAWIYFLHP